MATPASVLTVEDVPKKPHQPPARDKFPKRTFGKKKQCLVLSSIPGSTNGHSFTIVKRMTLLSASTQCLLAFKQRKISKQNTDPALLLYKLHQHNNDCDRV